MLNAVRSLFFTLSVSALILVLGGCDDQEKQDWIEKNGTTKRISLIGITYQYQLLGYEFKLKPSQSESLMFERLTQHLELTLEEGLHHLNWVDIEDIHREKAYLSASVSQNQLVNFTPYPYRFLDLKTQTQAVKEIAEESHLDYLMTLSFYVPLRDSEPQYFVNILIVDHLGTIKLDRTEPLGLFWRQLYKNNLNYSGKNTRVEHEDAVVTRTEGVDFENSENRALFEAVFKRYMRTNNYLLPLLEAQLK